MTSLGDRAADDLRFIRDAMARTATFTAVPGTGGALMGAVGLAASIVAARQSTSDSWLIVWLVAAAVAAAVGVTAIVLKARRASLALDGRTARHFATGLVAPLAAGAAITYALWTAGLYSVMPAVWLLLYGTGVLVGGMFAVRIVRITGVLFMAFGLAAVLAPQYGNFFLGAGFGALQTIGGIFIARRHGG
jgi:hypothetical protein